MAETKPVTAPERTGEARLVGLTAIDCASNGGTFYAA